MARPRSCDDERLVLLVAEHPAIYDACCGGYRDAQVKEGAWKAVADSTGKSLDECKKRWRDIRDHYFKIKRKKELGSAHRPPKWSLFESLTFLDGLKKERRSRCSKPQTDWAGEDEQTEPGANDCADEPEVVGANTSRHLPATEDSGAAASAAQASSRPAKSRRPPPRALSAVISEYDGSPGKRPRLVRTVATEDDVDAFFRSIALTVKSFPPHLVGAAKLRVLTVVNELERSVQFPSRSPSPG